MSRDAIPIEIKRAVYVEAGHRCAIPTCRAPSPLEIAHIHPWAKTKDNSFDNLICLCANCHARYDKNQDGFDKETMSMYKQNLIQVRGMFSDFENILFENMAQQDVDEVALNDFYQPFLYYSLRDGILKQKHSTSGNRINGRLLGPFVYALTEKGKAFISSLKLGKKINI